MLAGGAAAASAGLGAAGLSFAAFLSAASSGASSMRLLAILLLTRLCSAMMHRMRLRVQFAGKKGALVKRKKRSRETEGKRPRARFRVCFRVANPSRRELARRSRWRGACRWSW